MFFQKIPKSIISFCNYFLKLNFGFFLAQNISMNGPGFWRVMFLLSFSPAWQDIVPDIPWVKKKQNAKQKSKEIQMPPWFKFFIVEEVMSYSLFPFKSLNFNSPEKGKVILFPLIQKFWKVSNFTQVSITQANKQTI